MDEPTPGYVTVARTGEISEGGTKFVEVRGIPVVICRIDGQFYAVGNVCTHDAGPLSGGFLDDHQIECPRHGARFDVRTGEVRRLPAALPIPTYPLRVQGDEIQIKVG